MVTNVEKAKQIQYAIDEQFSFDVAAFENSELKRLARYINNFLFLNIDTVNLKSVDDMLTDDEEE